MSSLDARAIQRILISLGYDLGAAGADGVIGRKTTSAIAAFQKDRALAIRWPGTIGPLTQSALLSASGGRASVPILLPWLEEARRRLGLDERDDNAELRAWLKSDGHTVGDPARLPWCGDFVETCIALTLPHEPLPANPYLARNWLKFGQPIEPATGAILIFWRGSRTGIEGHVAFCISQNERQFLIRGGNQLNQVRDSWIDKDRLLGARWPSTFDLPAAGAVWTTESGASSTNEA